MHRSIANTCTWSFIFKKQTFPDTVSSRLHMPEHYVNYIYIRHAAEYPPLGRFPAYHLKFEHWTNGNCPFNWEHSIDSLCKTHAVRTEFTYVNPFCLKESSDEGANQLRSPPILPWYTLWSLVKVGGKLKKEFANNETWSFPCLWDMTMTVKVARTQTKLL